MEMIYIAECVITVSDWITDPNRFYSILSFDFFRVYTNSLFNAISSSEAKQAQPQCLCGVAPFFLYGVMRAILHFRLYFFRNNFRIAYLRNGLDLLRKVVLLVIIRLAAL